MSTSIIYTNLTGSQSNFAVPFDYLSKEHVKVTVNGGLTTAFTFLSSNMILMDVAPTGELRVYRDTPSETSLVTWTDGSILLEDDLNLGNLQTLFVTEELRQSSFTTGADGHWDADNLRISNLGEPIDEQDAVSLKYINENLKDFVSEAVDTAEGYRDQALVAVDTAEGYRDQALVALDTSEIVRDEAISSKDASILARDEAISVKNSVELLLSDIDFSDVQTSEPWMDVTPTVYSKVERIRPNWGLLDTPANTKATLESAMSYAVSSGGVLLLDRGTDYVFDNLVIPDNLIIEGRDYKFKPTNSISGDNSNYIIQCGLNVTAEELRVVTALGHDFDRGLNIQGNCTIGELIFVSEGQVASTTNSSQDFSVRITGDDNILDSVTIKNNDRSLLLQNNNNLILSYLNIDKCITGVFLDENIGVKFNHWNGTGDSSNLNWDGIGGTITPQQPGQNLVLFGKNKDIQGSSIQVYRTAEHGVRFGGSNDPTNEPTHDNYNISSISTERTGQCGTKIHTNFNYNHPASDITIGSITAVDAGAAGGVNSNDNGLMIEEGDGISVGSVTVRKKNFGFSCYDGIYIAGSDDVSIGHVQIISPKNTGITCESVVGDESNINNITIGGGSIRDAGGNGVDVSNNGSRWQSINITNMLVDNSNGKNWSVTPPSATVRVDSTSLMHGWSVGGGIADTISTGDPDIKDQVVQI